MENFSTKNVQYNYEKIITKSALQSVPGDKNFPARLSPENMEFRTIFGGLFRGGMRVAREPHKGIISRVCLFVTEFATQNPIKSNVRDWN